MSLRDLIFRDHKAYAVEDDREFELSSLTRHLQSTIREVSDFTFGDLWKLLVKDAAFFETAFAEAMGEFKLSDFAKPDEAPMPREDIDEPLDYLELSVGVTVTVWNGRGEDLPTDITPWSDIRGRKNNDETAYGISMTSIHELMAYPLKLETIATVLVYSHRSRKVDYSGVMPITLYDALCAILDEITFYGLPDNKASIIAGLDQSMAEIRDGVAKIVPLDELLGEDNT